MLPEQAQPTQMTFVAQRAPERSPDLCVIAPTAGDFSPEDSQFPFRGFPPWVADRELVTPGFQLRHLLFESINVAPRVGLSSVEAPGIQEQRGREPVP